MVKGLKWSSRITTAEVKHWKSNILQPCLLRRDRGGRREGKEGEGKEKRGRGKGEGRRWEKGGKREEDAIGEGDGTEKGGR